MNNVNNILSNRELAVLFWGIVYFLYAMRSSSARQSVVNVLIALWKARIAFLFIILLPTFIGVLLLGEIIHLDIVVCKEILIWMIMSALLNYSFEILKVKTNKAYFKLICKMMMSIPIIWFIVDYTSFSIWWELIIVPVSFYLTKLCLFDELNKKEYLNVKKLVNSLYVIFSIVWSYSFYKSINDTSFWSIETINIFIVSPVLTIIYAILVYPILLFCSYESSFKAININLDAQSRIVYKKKIWSFSRFNFNKIRHCEFYIYQRTYQSSDTLKKTIDLAISSYIKQSKKYEIQNN